MKMFNPKLFTFAALLCSLTANAKFYVDGIYYNITSYTDLTVEVTSDRYDSYLYDAVTIPSAVTYNSETYSVTSIGDYAFDGCSSLTSITIPDGVKSIEDHAFSGCSSLTSITIPDGVTSIGISAFSNCSSLTSITLPEGVKSIEDYAFYCCSRLTSITIPENSKLTNIGYDAFHECWSLSSITLPENSKLTNIRSGAFYGCSSLSAVCISDMEAWCNINFSGSFSNPLCYANNLYLNGELVTELIIPNTVTVIKNDAFSGCSSLTSIILPESVTSIGDRAFSGCSNLTSIIVEEGNPVYDSRENCNAIVKTETNELISGCQSTVIPESVTSIGESAFSGCSSLTSINIPEGVTSIGSWAFHGCYKLYKVFNSSKLSISKGLENYGYVAYYAKRVLNGIDIITIEDYQFYTSNGNHYLANYIGGDYNLVLPNNYNGENYYIDDYVFYGYDSMRSLTVGSGVLAIGNKVFSTVPEKIIWLTNTPPTGYVNAEGSINYVANDQYTSLSNVKVYPYLSSMFEVDGVKYVPVSPSERTCHAIDCTYDESVVAINVGETASFKGVAMKVTEVMPYTFYGNNHIKEVELSHLGNIGDYAFYNCTGMETAMLANYIPTPPSVDDVPQTFADWTSTNHSGNSTSSETYTFMADEGVALSFNWSVSSESGCDKLIVTLDDNTILEKSGSLNGTYNNAISKGSHTLMVKYTKDGHRSSGSDQASVSNIIVGKMVAGVGNEAFSACTSLKTVTLGDSIGSLGDKAFYQCTNLHEIVIPNMVSSIGAYCFGYSSLSEIGLPQSVVTIGDYAFKGCTQLADVIIEDRTTALTLGNNGSSPLFVDCPLDSVYIGGKITYNATDSKGYSPFYRNTSLRSVVITDREDQIYDNEFYGCTNLKNVAIGNGVKSIGDYAFSGCSSLDGFSFGSSMESIGAEAFSDCTNLTTLTSQAAVPPTCGTQALDDINKWNCTLHVPTGCTAAYQAEDQWKEFFFIEDTVSGIEQLTIDKQGSLAEGKSNGQLTIYDLAGRKVLDTENLEGGIYIVNGKKVVIK